MISVGAWHAFTEACFKLMKGVNIKYYDREPLNKFSPVEQAEFPKDIEKCLPDNCNGCLLFSGYPEGYLGAVLKEFIRR